MARRGFASTRRSSVHRRSWSALGAVSGGIVAIHAPDGINLCSGQAAPLDCWELTGPLRSWTSADGSSWTAHTGPDLKLGEMSGVFNEHPSVTSGTDAHLIAVAHRAELAVSSDGVTWRNVSAQAFGKGFGPESPGAIPAGLVSIGSTAKSTTAVSSADGKTWTAHALSDIPTGNNEIVAGSSGLVATGLEYFDSGAATWHWWSSLDGKTWKALSNYPPLGR